MSNDDFKVPDLPSDEELGIAGLSEDDFQDAADQAPRTQEAPPPPPPPASGSRSAPTAPPPGGPPARSRWRGPATLLALIVLAWASAPGRAIPGPVPANAPDSVFSSGRAMATLVEVARRPHVVGSPEHARVRELIVERLQELGLEPEIQTTTSLRPRGDGVRAATVRNIVARVPGTSSTGAVLLTAHYDAVPLSSGAGDDGTGVVVILETLRALLTGPARANDLIVLITDAEELGLLGARAFVAEHELMRDVGVVLSVEMRGGGGPSIMFETGAENGWIVQAFGASAPRPTANAVSVDIYRRLPNDTDFTPFRDAGVQGLNFAAIDRADIYHQASDIPANVDEATLQHHGVNLLAVTRHLADADLTDVHAPDRAYVTAPFVGLVSHPASWSLIGGGALLVLALLATLLVKARGGSLAGVGVGALLGLLTIAGTSGAGYGLFRGVRSRHAEYGALNPAFYEEGWYVLALVGVALALGTTLFGLARRRFGLASLALGGTLPALAAAFAVVFMAPLAAPNLIWPVAAALLASMLATAVRPGSEPGIALWLGALVFAVPVLGVLVAPVELVWVAMSFRLAPVIGGMIALTLLLMLPALEGLAHPNRWWAPVLGLVLAGAFTGAGLLRAGPSAERPAPSTLVYTLDRDAGLSLWASTPGPALSWARERTGTEMAESSDLSAFRRSGEWQTAAAPAVDAPPPSATVRADTVLDGRRRIDMAVVTPLGAESVSLVLPADGPWMFTEVNGHALGALTPGETASREVRRLEHWGVAEETLSVRIEAPAGVAPPRFWAVEELFRPAELLGNEPFQRPDSLMPNAIRGSDRALIRTPILLGTDADGPPATLRTDSVAPPVPDTAGLVPPPDTTSTRRTPHPWR